jgi:hypothetical protein
MNSLSIRLWQSRMLINVPLILTPVHISMRVNSVCFLLGVLFCKLLNPCVKALAEKGSALEGIIGKGGGTHL